MAFIFVPCYRSRRPSSCFCLQLKESGLDFFQQEHGECPKHRTAGCAGDSHVDTALAIYTRTSDQAWESISWG